MAFRVDWDQVAREELMRLPVAERVAVMVVLAIGPEAQQDKRGFDRSVRLAEERLREIRGWHDN